MRVIDILELVNDYTNVKVITESKVYVYDGRNAIPNRLNRCFVEEIWVDNDWLNIYVDELV